MKKLIPFLFLMIISSCIVLSINFVPQGDIVGMNRYDILNFSSICFNSSCIYNWSDVVGGGVTESYVSYRMLNTTVTGLTDYLNASIISRGNWTADKIGIQSDISSRMLNITVTSLLSERLLNATMYDYVSYRMLNTTATQISNYLNASIISRGNWTADKTNIQSDISNRMLNTTVTSLLSERLLNATMYDYVSYRMLNTTVTGLVGERVLNSTLTNYMPNSSIWSYVSYRMLNTTVTGLVSSRVLNGSDANIVLNWTKLQNYPVSCPADTYLTGINDSTTCSAITSNHIHTNSTISSVNFSVISMGNNANALNFTTGLRTSGNITMNTVGLGFYYNASVYKIFNGSCWDEAVGSTHIYTCP